MFTETMSHYITQTGLKVMILLSSWPHKCEDFPCILPHMHICLAFSSFWFVCIFYPPFMFFFLSFFKKIVKLKNEKVNTPKYKPNIIIILCFFKVILGDIFYYI